MPLESLDPVIDKLQVIVVEFIHATLALLVDSDQPHFAQDAQMLGNDRLRQSQRQDDGSHCQVSVLRQQINDLPPPRLGDGVENVRSRGGSWHGWYYIPI